MNSQPKAQSAHNSNTEGNASTATNNPENHDDNITIISYSEQNSNDMERENDLVIQKNKNKDLSQKTLEETHITLRNIHS